MPLPLALFSLSVETLNQILLDTAHRAPLGIICLQIQLARVSHLRGPKTQGGLVFVSVQLGERHANVGEAPTYCHMHRHEKDAYASPFVEITLTKAVPQSRVLLSYTSSWALPIR